VGGSDGQKDREGKQPTLGPSRDLAARADVMMDGTALASDLRWGEADAREGIEALSTTQDMIATEAKTRTPEMMGIPQA
jgi:hypothetical protein